MGKDILMSRELIKGMDQANISSIKEIIKPFCSEITFKFNNIKARLYNGKFLYVRAVRNSDKFCAFTSSEEKKIITHKGIRIYNFSKNPKDDDDLWGKDLKLLEFYNCFEYYLNKKLKKDIIQED